MSARSFEVSFRTGPLVDREVEEVADELFELGFDDICFRPLPDPSRPYAVSDRDALRAANQHDVQRSLKW